VSQEKKAETRLAQTHIDQFCRKPLRRHPALSRQVVLRSGHGVTKQEAFDRAIALGGVRPQD